MEVTIRQKETVTILDLNGELDLYHSDLVRDMIHKEIDSGTIHMILNCQNLTYLDSSGLGALIINLQYVRSKKGYIRLIHLNGSPKTVLELSNAIRLFPIFSSEEEALQA